ncbi:hypothetical protein GCM10023170_077240 [Phytohabitans houttuyneae]|uniref:Uncharacterized protein n=2 Tax=Phytohabitans houttuyneae TaxID=1076126 RepID=A0A6V8KSX0_9ACTN|nr:hypothetical protein Phou_090770 [Phytohabitans houttuyneae]
MAPKARGSSPPLVREDELVRLRHVWVVFVLTHGTHPAIKQTVLEAAAQAGRRVPGPRKALEG